jgi:hypothetical protein
MSRLIGVVVMMGGVCLVQKVSAAVIVNSLNVPYSQDFNGLIRSGTATFVDDSTIAGWTVNSEAMANDGNQYSASTGSSTTGDVYSFGATESIDRSLGYLGSGSNDYFNAAVIFTNSTGSVINEVSLSFTGEQWRSGGVTSDNLNVLAFAWQVGSGISIPANRSTSGWTVVPALEFSAPNPNTPAGALDGNDPTNQTRFTNFSLSSLAWPDGQQLALRWIGNDGSGTDAGLAIDDLTVIPVPEPSLLGLSGLGAALALRGLRRRW